MLQKINSTSVAERSFRLIGFLNSNELSNNNRISHHFDDYKRVKEIT